MCILPATAVCFLELRKGYNRAYLGRTIALLYSYTAVDFLCDHMHIMGFKAEIEGVVQCRMLLM